MTRIAVIGAGLAGLTAAVRLGQRCEVHLLEAGERLGGQIHTETSAGFVIERGDEGFVARSAAVPVLARVLPVRGRPLQIWVSICPNALPVFNAEPRAAVAALEAALVPYPVLLAGSAFHGSGIAAAVRSAECAAAAVAFGRTIRRGDTTDAHQWLVDITLIRE